jgi:pimeloyl-ACP methyl ester carboxylesterase
MRTVRAAILLLTGMFLSGCFSDSTSSGEENVGPTDPTSGNGAPTTPPATTSFRPQFQPLSGIFPYPNDLYFSGSTDGTLNLPLNPFQPTASTINQLDGFSTTAYLSARFVGGAIDPATLTAANVRVIRLMLSNTTKAPIAPPTPADILVFNTDFSATVSTEAGSAGGTLIIRPLKPLTPSAGANNFGYLVLLTNGIKNTTGVAAAPDTDYQTVRDQAISEIQAGASTPTCTPITNATLNAICKLTFAHLQIGAAIGVSPATVVVSFSFSTESTGDTLAALTQIIAASPAPVLTVAAVPNGVGGTLNTKNINPALPGIANIYAGTLRVPYYLSAPSTANPIAPVNRFWTAAAGPPPVLNLDPSSRNLTRFNPVPAKTADLDIPIVVTVPNISVQPPTGWPVAIFQHGLTRNRTDALFMADAFAQAGFVVVSIDLPLHGLVPTNPLSPIFRQAGKELTFDLDVSNNGTLAPGPDGQIDGSGQNFVNLSSLLTTRDNLRQGAVDLLALTKALSGLDLNGDGTGDADLGKIHFVGHSLGSIVGGVYATFGSNARTASLLMTGGGVAQTIVDSPTFGPAINNALTAQGLAPGTTLYNQFLRDAQTAADAGDPLNYISTLVGLKPVHITQIVGPPPDQVVPNSSTQRMITAAGTMLHKVSAPGPNPTGAGNGGYVNFTAGVHGSAIDPTSNLMVTQEIQGETVAFAVTDGAAILVNPANLAVIQP